MTNFSQKELLLVRDAGGLTHKMVITQNTSISKETKRFAMNDFKEAFTVSVTDALDSHCNTLDLRMPLQCKFWIEELPDQVQRFITLGGYRLYPDYIKVEQDHKTLTLFHSWKNYGVGVLPNNHPNWNYKYQVSFVLMNEKRKLYFFIQNRKQNLPNG